MVLIFTERNLTLEMGQEFANAGALKIAVCEQAIRSGYDFKRARTGPHRYRIKCLDKACSWRIHADRDVGSSSSFRISMLDLKHTCSRPLGSIKKRATINWIANFIKMRMKEGADYRTANDVVRDIETRYNHLIKLSSNKVWRARELAVRNYKIGHHEQCRNHEEESDVMIHTQRRNDEG